MANLSGFKFEKFGFIRDGDDYVRFDMPATSFYLRCPNSRGATLGQAITQMFLKKCQEKTKDGELKAKNHA